MWIKWAWRCPHLACPPRTWTETTESIAPRASSTQRARKKICRQVGQDAAAVTRKFGIGWRTAMTAVRDHGTPRVDNPGRLNGIEALGVDKTVFRPPRPPARSIS